MKLTGAGVASRCNQPIGVSTMPSKLWLNFSATKKFKNPGKDFIRENFKKFTMIFLNTFYLFPTV